MTARDDAAPEVAGAGLVAGLVGFARALRDAGVRVGAGQVVILARGLARLERVELDDLYFVGRTCLVTRHDDLAAYDLVFSRLFRAAGALAVRTAGELPDTTPAARARLALPGEGADGRRAPERSGALASGLEVLRAKDFADCSDAELARIRALLAQIALGSPLRRVRRTVRARTGVRPDLRRALRTLLRADAVAPPRSWRRREVRVRPIVLLLDVSGSMSRYSRVLLQFAYAVTRASGRVEVFCFGTRLTRVSAALARRDPDEALARAAATVLDWDGGTRIGESVRSYVRDFARRAGLGGAVVVICSDGLERGDPELLATEMARLGRLAHRVVWVNPLKGGAGFEPATRGMRAAMPAVHFLLSGHNLAGLDDLATLLGALS